MTQVLQVGATPQNGKQKLKEFGLGRMNPFALRNRGLLQVLDEANSSTKVASNRQHRRVGQCGYRGVRGCSFNIPHRESSFVFSRSR